MNGDEEYVGPASAGPVAAVGAEADFVGSLYAQLAVHGSISIEYWNRQVAHWSNPANKYANQIRRDIVWPSNF